MINNVTFLSLSSKKPETTGSIALNSTPSSLFTSSSSTASNASSSSSSSGCSIVA